VHLMLICCGEPDPWRRRYLRFAVDRSILIELNGEFRFIHLLVRDHLAECNSAELGAAIIERGAELRERRRDSPPRPASTN
jgi:hypothetical protein